MYLSILAAFHTLRDTGHEFVLAVGLLEWNTQTLGAHRWGPRVLGCISVDTPLTVIFDIVLALAIVTCVC